MSRVPTPQQRARIAGPISFGNCLQPPLLHPRSSVFDIEQKELNLYVAIKDRKPVQVRISNAMRVSDLVEQINSCLEEGEERPCVFFGKDAMHYNDILAEWGILDGSIIQVHGRELVPITISIKLTEVNRNFAQITANQTITGFKIKTDIHSQHDLDPSFMRLFHAGVELEDKSSLADLGIYANCTLLLKYCKPKGFQEDCTIRLRDYSNIRIRQAMDINEVLSFKTTSESKIHSKPQVIENHQTKEFDKIALANSTEVVCSHGVYFYTQDSRWVTISGMEKDRLKRGDTIMTASGEFVAVENIHSGCQSLNPTNLTYLLLSKYTPYFVNDVLVSPALDIQVFYRGEGLLSFDIHPSMNIADLKGKISRKLRKQPSEQHLFIESQNLMLKDGTKLSQIYTKNLIIQLYCDEAQLKKLIKSQKMIRITFERVTKKVSYTANAELTCGKIIAREFPQKVQQFPFFGALLGRKVIDLNTKIVDIMDREEEQFYYEHFEIIVIKFPERFKLAQILKQFKPLRQPEPTTASILRAVLSIFSRNSNEPTLLRNYRKNHMMNEVREVLGNLHKQRLTNNGQHPKFSYISQLIHFLKQRPQYVKKCYRVLINTQLPEDFTENNIINIREFLSCSPSKEMAQGLLNRRGVLLSIQSISGKVLDLGEEGTEVVFLPYTYFIIGKVTRQGQITHVELAEMPTALAFSKHIVLWVDDRPQNNIECIAEFRKKGTEVIQLSSTAMARRWFEEFGWIVNRLNLRMRVITDMVREEPDRNREGEFKPNYEAGIDLIEYLFTERGFTTPVLVFCSDFMRGRDNIEKRKIRPDRFHQVTNQYEILKKYMAFQISFQSRLENP